MPVFCKSSEISTSAAVYVLLQAASSGDVTLVGSVRVQGRAVCKLLLPEDAYDCDKTPDVCYPHLEGEAENEDSRMLRLLVTDPAGRRQRAHGLPRSAAGRIRRAEQECAERGSHGQTCRVLTTVIELNGAYHERRRFFGARLCESLC